MKSNRIVLIVAIIIGVMLFFQLRMATGGVDAVQAQSMTKQGVLLLDVREQDEYESMHVPNAKLIPLGELGSRLQEIEAYKNKPILVMCHSGMRSARAVSQLQEAGFTQASSVNGGIIAWQKAGLEVVQK